MRRPQTHDPTAHQPWIELAAYPTGWDKRTLEDLASAGIDGTTL